MRARARAADQGWGDARHSPVGPIPMISRYRRLDFRAEQEALGISTRVRWPRPRRMSVLESVTMRQYTHWDIFRHRPPLEGLRRGAGLGSRQVGAGSASHPDTSHRYEGRSRQVRASTAGARAPAPHRVSANAASGGRGCRTRRLLPNLARVPPHNPQVVADTLVALIGLNGRLRYRCLQPHALLGSPPVGAQNSKRMSKPMDEFGCHAGACA